MIFGSILSLLAILPLATGLWYAYRNINSSKKVFIPSLFLLKTLKPSSLKTNKIKLPLLFWLELIFISLVILYIADPKILVDGKKVLIVIDNSLSMNSFDGDEKCIDKAKNSAIKYLNSLSSFNTYSLKILGGSGVLNFKEALSKDEVINNINSLKPPTGIDSTEIISLEDSKKYSSAAVFTDKSLKESKQNITVFSVRENQSSNIAIFRKDQTNFSIKNFSKFPSKIELVQNSKSTLITLLPLEEKSFSIIWDENGSFNASIVPKTEDVLADDNILKIKKDNLKRVAVVGGDINNYSGLPISTGIVTELSNSKLENYSGIILDSPKAEQIETALTLKKPLMIVNPPMDKNSKIYSYNQVANSRPVIWDNAHPILSYVEPKALEFSTTANLTSTFAASVLLSNEFGSILIAGTTNQDIKFVASGFNMFVPTLKQKGIKILGLNILEWLFNNKNTNFGFIPLLKESDFTYVDAISLNDLINTSTVQNTFDLQNTILTSALVILITYSILLVFF